MRRDEDRDADLLVEREQRRAGVACARGFRHGFVGTLERAVAVWVARAGEVRREGRRVAAMVMDHEAGGA